MKTNARGLEIIQESEGCFYEVYKCPAGLPTIGYGHVVLPGEVFCEPITKDQAIEILKLDIAKAERQLDNICPVPMNINRYSALVSLIFNIGIGNFKKSKLFDLVCKKDWEGVAAEFQKFTRAHINGKLKILPGLVKRREKEALLFLTPIEERIDDGIATKEEQVLWG